MEALRNYGTWLFNIRDSNPYDLIKPGLYLGSYLASKPKEVKFFDTVVNCSKSLTIYKSEPGSIYRLPVNDDSQIISSIDLCKYAQLVLPHINLAILEDKKVLVHCRAGMQRSAAVVAMYLMKYYEMSVEEAIEYIKSIRDVAFDPIPKFIYTLRLFEANGLDKHSK